LASRSRIRKRSCSTRTVETRQPSITNTLPYPADADDHTTLAERTSR
jgi:hypothetical protein